MYNLNNICPRCRTEIAEERLRIQPVVCQACGESHSSNGKDASESATKLSIVLMFAAAIFMSASFLHSTRWGEFSLEILPLKAASTLGMASPDTYARMQQICLERKMIECVESNLVEQIQLNPKNLEALQELALLHYKLERFDEATDMYNAYFNNGGRDLEPAYFFAKTLSNMGQIDEATKYFDFVLASKTDVIQVTVTEAYVDMLMAADLYEEAQKVADSVTSRTDKVPPTLTARFERVKDALKNKKL